MRKGAGGRGRRRALADGGDDPGVRPADLQVVRAVPAVVEAPTGVHERCDRDGTVCSAASNKRRRTKGRQHESEQRKGGGQKADYTKASNKRRRTKGRQHVSEQQKAEDKRQTTRKRLCDTTTGGCATHRKPAWRAPGSGPAQRARCRRPLARPSGSVRCYCKWLPHPGNEQLVPSCCMGVGASLESTMLENGAWRWAGGLGGRGAVRW